MTGATSLSQRLREEVQALLDQRQQYDDEAKHIDEALHAARRELTWDDDGVTAGPDRRASAAPTVKPAVKRPSSKSSFRENVYAILKNSEEPLGEDEIARKLTAAGFESDKPPDEFIRDVYTEGVHPLIREGRVESVGEPPNRKYRVS